MTKPGRFPDSPEPLTDACELGSELKRLRRPGLADLALRPHRYPALTTLLGDLGQALEQDTLGLLQANARLFGSAIDLLPSEHVRRAASILFHVGRTGPPPPLDQRRRAADRAFTGNAYSREPDTIQRYLERDLIDPLLIEALRRLQAQTTPPGAPQAVSRRCDTRLGEDGFDRTVARHDRRDADSETDAMNRRAFLRASSLAGTLAAFPPAATPVDHERIASIRRLAGRLDSVTVDELGALNDQLWHLFAAANSKASVLTLARAQLDVLVKALEQSGGATLHQRLCALMGDLLQLAGEIFFDGDRYVEAAHCYNVAATVSKEADAFDLWACAMVRHAFICVYERRFGTAVPMLDQARQLAKRGDPGLSTRHWVSAVAAQALAGLGDAGACERAVASAAGVSSLSGRVQNGGWLRFDGSRLAEEQGACYVELGRPDRAQPVLASALRQELSVRRRGTILTDLAIAGVQRGDLDQAAHYAVDAIQLARQTGSAVVRRRLQGLRTRLPSLLDDGRMRELDHQIGRLSATPATH